MRAGDGLGVALGEADGQGFSCTTNLTTEPSGFLVPAAGLWLTTSPRHLPSPVVVPAGLRPILLIRASATLSVTFTTDGTSTRSSAGLGEGEGEGEADGLGDGVGVGLGFGLGELGRTDGTAAVGVGVLRGRERDGDGLGVGVSTVRGPVFEGSGVPDPAEAMLIPRTARAPTTATPATPAASGSPRPRLDRWAASLAAARRDTRVPCCDVATVAGGTAGASSHDSRVTR